MGQVVLGVAGAVIGSYTGIGPTAGYMLGSALGAALFPPEGADGPRLSDLRVQDSTYGAAIPIIFGRYRTSGNIMWSTKLIEHEGETDSGSGGGGTTNYTYTVSFAVGICAGPILGISRIWADGKMIFDKTANRINTGVGFNAGAYRIYLGDENQLPDPAIEVDKGVGNVPAHRGMAYIVFEDLELGKFGNRIPGLTFEVLTHGTNVNDGVLTAGEVPVAEVIDRLSALVGMRPDQVSTSAVTNFLEGFGVTGQMSARSALEPLMTANFIDVVESDRQVKFVLRGMDSVAVIPLSHTLMDDAS